MTLRDRILYPSFSITCLVSSVLTLTVSILTFIRIYRGSKSHFAYLLLFFTFCYGLNRLGWVLLNTFYMKTQNMPNGYGSISNSYFLLL